MLQKLLWSIHETDSSLIFVILYLKFTGNTPFVNSLDIAPSVEQKDITMKLMDTPDKKDKLLDAIKLFYDNVMEQKDIRHFFFGMNIEKLIKDIELYEDFVMPKPERFYRETFSQTAPSAIQIKAPQFDELQITLQTSLRSGGYLKTQIPLLSAKLLELFEETRAQMADENIKVWKAFEVTNQMVCDLYNANRTDARLEKNGDVYGSRGFLYPFWTRVTGDTKQIIFIGQGFSTSVDTPLEAVETFCKQVNDKFKHQKFQVRKSPQGPVLFARQAISYVNGVPTRMLMRGAKMFASTFEAAMNMDNDKLLKNVIR